MITIVNCAKKKHGKTTITKGYLNAFHGNKLIYDVNAEYKEYGSAAIFPRPFTKFLELAIKAKETCVVFEEAFIFFDHASSSEEIKELLVRNRHTKNLIIFNFHAIHQIPMFVWDFTNYLVLGKTNDKQKWIDNNYKDTAILESYNELKADPDKWAKITLDIDAEGM